MEINEFFRQATLHICGNLKVEAALFSTLLFIRQQMPVSHMFLEHYDESLDAMRTIAIATRSGGKAVDLLTSLSGSARQQAEHKYRQKSEKVYLFKDPNEELLAQEMLSFHGVKAGSLMVMPLEVDGRILGTLAVASEGNSEFSRRHADLLALLKEPFAVAMSNALQYREVVQLKEMLSEDNRYLHNEMRQLAGDEIVGANFGLRDVMEKVQHVAALESPVLLLGETGVGKDIIANTIHFLSLRKDAPFIKVNCGAIPEALVDSELFGHEKGAFTGAVAQKRGRFERAQTGTLLLDEIGELPLEAQVRLLRVLQDKEIERVGGHKSISLNIRIIAATNRNLEEMVKTGYFREDLWYRLNVFPIWIPPLRQRKADIPALVDYFLQEKSRELKLPDIPRVAPGQIELLINYDWPGNVRELQNLIERALILKPKGPLTFESIHIQKQQQVFSEVQQPNHIEKLDVIVGRHISFALSRSKGKIHGKGGAAELLGINPNTLRSRMRKLGIHYGRNRQM
jgi:transcriptional regulator with GAF, ATPase, and Fis domain